jgi:hypothetical protein
MAMIDIYYEEKEAKPDTFQCLECEEVKDKSEQAKAAGGQNMPYCRTCLPDNEW